MNKDTAQLGGDLAAWHHVKTNDPRPLFGVTLTGFYSERYERDQNGEPLSLGCFFLHDTELYRAWGRVADEHCSFHSLRLPDGIMSEPIAGCPDVSLILNDAGAHIVIKRDGQEVIRHPTTVAPTT